MEYVLFFAALALGIAALTAGRGERRPAWRTAGVVAAVTLALSALWKPAVDDLAGAVPAPLEGEGFVSSTTCRSCHPREYDTWHATFHRTMTQVAGPHSVLAPFDGVHEDRGRRYVLSREGDEFWVDMIDPLWEIERPRMTPDRVPADAPRVKQRVVMTTGSHHLQAYWVQRPDSNGVYYQLPLIYSLADQRWIPSQDSFLAPPTEVLWGSQTWNVMCAGCHSVATAPRMQVDPETGRGTMFSHSAELGIACESCHGPADDHASANRWPHRRYGQHFSAERDPTVVNPAALDHRRSSEVCGQCHSFSAERDKKQWLEDGPAYRAGDVLDETKVVFTYSHDREDPLLKRKLAADPQAMDGHFWGDGTIRVAGREYNGLLETGCFQRGEMSCLSCHSMHDYADPSDLLTSGLTADQSCAQCHPDVAADVEEHTHHAPGSSGSSCVNCHMPHTTYGLFTAIRSHRIDSPSVEVSARTGRPNACNQCHVDQSLAWTQEHLTDWYGHDRVALSPAQEEVSATLIWLLEGDAAQRALAAWSLGWDEARAVSGEGWQAPFLARLLVDPYAAVRKVAHTALRKLPGFEALEFDFVADVPARLRVAEGVLDRWGVQPDDVLDRQGPNVLIDQPRAVREKVVSEMLRRRDNRPVRIVE